MRQKRREILTFSPYDLTGMERHLERMSEKGWMLDCITNLIWTYRRAQPRSRKFAVSYYPLNSEFAPGPSEEQLDFQEFCTHAGWKLAAASGSLQIFYNEEEDPTPLHTDPDTQLKTVERAMKKTMPFYVIFALLGLWQGGSWCWTLLHEPIDLLASPINLFSGFLWLLLVIYTVSDLTIYLTWRRRARRAARQGQFVPTRGCRWLTQAVLAVIVLGVVFCLFTVRLPGMQLTMFAMLAAIVLLIVVVNGTKWYLKRKQVSAGVNRAVTLMVDVVLAFALMGGITFGLLHAFQTDTFSLEAHLTPPLKLEELTGEDTTDYVIRTRLEESVFLAQFSYDLRPDFDAEDWGNKSHMDYTIVDVRLPALYSLCFKQLWHAYDDWGPYDEGDEEGPYYAYRPMDTVPAGVEAAYQQWAYDAPNERYLLCWEDRLVTLETSWPLTAEQMDTAARLLSGAGA